MLQIILAILAFGILVIVHEFGHFITAKRGGVQVNEFWIGMGPVSYTHLTAPCPNRTQSEQQSVNRAAQPNRQILTSPAAFLRSRCCRPETTTNSEASV